MAQAIGSDSGPPLATAQFYGDSAYCNAVHGHQHATNATGVSVRFCLTRPHGYFRVAPRRGFALQKPISPNITLSIHDSLDIKRPIDGVSEVITPFTAYCVGSYLYFRPPSRRVGLWLPSLRCGTSTFVGSRTVQQTSLRLLFSHRSIGLRL